MGAWPAAGRRGGASRWAWLSAVGAGRGGGGGCSHPTSVLCKQLGRAPDTASTRRLVQFEFQINNGFSVYVYGHAFTKK